jgi:hypothetical protein
VWTHLAVVSCSVSSVMDLVLRSFSPFISPAPQPYHHITHIALDTCKGGSGGRAWGRGGEGRGVVRRRRSYFSLCAFSLARASASAAALLSSKRLCNALHHITITAQHIASHQHHSSVK